MSDTVDILPFVDPRTVVIVNPQSQGGRLGKRWQQLHRLVYVAGLTAVIHFWWVVKADFREPRLFALALSILLAFRAWWTLRTRLSSRF